MAEHQPRYYQLLYSAAQASKAVDGFDLVDGDPASRSRFALLIAAQRDANEHLVLFVANFADELCEEFGEVG